MLVDSAVRNTGSSRQSPMAPYSVHRPTRGVGSAIFTGRFRLCQVRWVSIQLEKLVSSM